MEAHGERCGRSWAPSTSVGRMRRGPGDKAVVPGGPHTPGLQQWGTLSGNGHRMEALAPLQDGVGAQDSTISNCSVRRELVKCSAFVQLIRTPSGRREAVYPCFTESTQRNRGMHYI